MMPLALSTHIRQESPRSVATGAPGTCDPVSSHAGRPSNDALLSRAMDLSVTNGLVTSAAGWIKSFARIDCVAVIPSTSVGPKSTSTMDSGTSDKGNKVGVVGWLFSVHTAAPGPHTVVVPSWPCVSSIGVPDPVVFENASVRTYEGCVILIHSLPGGLPGSCETKKAERVW